VAAKVIVWELSIGVKSASVERVENGRKRMEETIGGQDFIWRDGE
jgi:hypothetical protein